MSEPQLERSVLEAKEREELYAIADALGTKPGSRAKKADLIAQILRATGVEADAPEPVDKPRRTRAKKAAANRRSDRRRRPTARTGPERPTARPPQSNEPVAERRRRRRRSRRRRPARRQRRRSTRLSRRRRRLRGRPARRPSDRRQRLERRPPTPARPRTGPPRPAGRSGASPAPGPARAPAASRAARRPDAGRPAAQRPPDTLRGRARQPPQPAAPGPRARGAAGCRPGRAPSACERDLQGQGAEQQFSGEPIQVKGFLDLRDEGYGFLRTKGFLAGPNDVYVSISQVRRFALRKGDEVEGASRPAASNEKYPALLRIDTRQRPRPRTRPGSGPSSRT